jgi:hypothetical protein
MPIPYPILNATDTGSLYTLFSFVNNGVAGMFMPIMLAVIWIIAFIGILSEGRQASRAWVFASFISSILAVILALIGMLSPNYMYFIFILTGIGVIWNYLGNSPGS